MVSTEATAVAQPVSRLIRTKEPADVGALACVLAAAAAYVALTIVQFLPVIRGISTAFPADARDPLLNAWILWWNAHRVPLTHAWWNAPAFYPADGTLALSEHLLGLSVIATPIQWAGASPVLAYNILFLLSFPLSALTAYWLGFAVTRRHDAAFLAGLAFGFNPYRVSQLPHIQTLASFWMPLMFVGLHGFARTARRRFLALFAGAWLLQALSNGYYLLFLPVFLVGWLLWFLPPRVRARQAARVVLVWGSASLALWPVAAGYFAVHDRYGLRRSFAEIAAGGAHLTSLLNMSPLLAIWRSPFPSRQPEKDLFPGATIVVLISVAMMRACRRSPPSPPLRARLSAVAARMTRAYRRHSVLGFYVLGAVAMWVLSLGPAPTFRGRTFWPGAPYAWLMVLPGYRSIRVPARFAALMMLCLSTAASVAFERLASVGSRRRRLVLAATVAIGLVVDGWPRPLPMFAAPARLDLRESGLPPSAAVLELPLGDEEADSAAVYRTVDHHRPVVNGYSGFFPPHYRPLAIGLGEHDDEMLTALATQGPIVIVVDEQSDRDGAWTRYVTQHAGVARVGSAGTKIIYLLPRAPRAFRLPGADLALRRVISNGRELPLTESRAGGQEAADKRPIWASDDRGKGGEALMADLGAVHAVHAVELVLEPGASGFPRDLLVELSDDGAHWQGVWQGHGSVLAFRAALDNPRALRMACDVGVRSARFIRVRQRAADPIPWAVEAVSVLAPS